MSKIILLYRLKEGVSAETFEAWVCSSDYPAMRGLTRVSAFTTHRAERLLMGDGRPSVDYVEVFDVPDLDGFLSEDMGGPVVQRIMGEFMQHVEAPEFIVAEDVV